MKLLLAIILMLLTMPISYAMLDLTVRKLRTKIWQSQENTDNNSEIN